MRRFVLLSSISLALPAAGSTAAPLMAQTPDDDAAAVRGVVESVARHAQAGDLDALGTLFADGRGVHIIEGAGVNHGWEEYRNHHLAPELEAFENLEYRYFAVEPVVKGDLAYAAFRYELSADTPDGHLEVEGRGTAVLERAGDAWKIVHLHTSGRRRSEDRPTGGGARP